MSTASLLFTVRYVPLDQALVSSINISAAQWWSRSLARLFSKLDAYYRVQYSFI